MNKPDEIPDDLSDKQVRNAYGALPAVHTPVELDRAVLRQAAAQRPLAESRSWMRPLAFAATAILGVALLFETADGPMPETKPGSREELVGTERAKPAETSRQNGVPANAAVRDDSSTSPDIADTDKPARRAARFAADSRAERAATDPDQARRERRPTATGPADTPELRASDNHEKQLQEAATPSAAAIGRASLSAAPPPAQRRCDRTDTATVENWWQCIQALREADNPAGADAELTELLRQHPDFRGHLK